MITTFQRASSILENCVHCRLGGTGLSHSSVSDFSTSVAIVFRRSRGPLVLPRRRPPFLARSLQRERTGTVIGEPTITFGCAKVWRGCLVPYLERSIVRRYLTNVEYAPSEVRGIERTTDDGTSLARSKNRTRDRAK